MIHIPLAMTSNVVVDGSGTAFVKPSNWNAYSRGRLAQEAPLFVDVAELPLAFSLHKKY
jgi:hypothetical protein